MSINAQVVASLSNQPTLIEAGVVQARRQYAVWDDGVVRLLDDRLEEIESRRVTLPATARLNAAVGLDRLLVTAEDRLMVIDVGDGDRVEISGVKADAAVFVAGLVLATAPGPAGETHRVLLIDPRAGAVLAEEEVDADYATAFITVHPSEPVALIELAMGQDGCMVVRAEVTDGALQLSEVLPAQDAVVAGFNPAGDRLLVTPHPSDPDAVRVFSWPSLDELGRLTGDSVGAEIGIGLAACWVDDDRVAAYSMEDALLVADADLWSWQRVGLPTDFSGEGDLESLRPLAPGRVAVGVWTPSGRSTLVVEL